MVIFNYLFFVAVRQFCMEMHFFPHAPFCCALKSIGPLEFHLSLSQDQLPLKIAFLPPAVRARPERLPNHRFLFLKYNFSQNLLNSFGPRQQEDSEFPSTCFKR